MLPSSLPYLFLPTYNETKYKTNLITLLFQLQMRLLKKIFSEHSGKKSLCVLFLGSLLLTNILNLEGRVFEPNITF